MLRVAVRCVWRSYSSVLDLQPANVEADRGLAEAHKGIKFLMMSRDGARPPLPRQSMQARTGGIKNSTAHSGTKRHKFVALDRYHAPGTCVLSHQDSQSKP